jgi:hypothetical protein
MSRQGTWFALLLASAISAACRGEVVGPADGGPDTADDGLAPRIFGLAPSALVQVLNDTEVWFHVEDPPSADGTSGSGVDIGSVQVRVQGGASLPITQQGPSFHASIASLPEGPTVLDVSVRDRAGNEATSQFDFVLDRTPPVATLAASPQADVTSGDWSTTIGLAGSVTDEHGLSVASYLVARPGPNGECDPLDAPFEMGTARGKVEQNRYPLHGADTGFDVRATLINATTGPDDTPRTTRYCGVFLAMDTARNAAGLPAGNAVHQAFTHDVTWQPLPFPSPTDLAGRWAVTYSQPAFACLRPYLNGYGSADAPFFAVEGVGDQALLQVTLPDGWGPISGAYERIRGQFTGHREDVVLPEDWYAHYRTWRVLPTESWDVAFDGPANAPFFVGRAHVEWAYDMAEYFDLDEGWTVPAHSVECSTEVSVFGEKLP